MQTSVVVATPAKWTLDDYHQMVESDLLDCRRVELVRGDIVEMPPESPLHADRVDVVAHNLRSLLGDRALIREGRPIALPPDSEPEPDIAVVKPQSYSDRHPGPEDVFWLIEISKTTSEFDLGAKAAAYAASAIAEDWAIDVSNRKLIIHRQPEREGYPFQESLRAGQVRAIAFPDIEIAVDRLLG